MNCTFSVSIIGVGGVLGVEDLTPPGSRKLSGRHQSTVTCISEKADVFFLSNDDFFGSFFRHMKLSNLTQLIFDQKVPFYNQRV